MQVFKRSYCNQAGDTITAIIRKSGNVWVGECQAIGTSHSDSVLSKVASYVDDDARYFGFSPITNES